MEVIRWKPRPRRTLAEAESPCRQLDNLSLLQYALQTMPVHHRRGVDQHLLRCLECRRVAGRLREIFAELEAGGYVE